MSRTKKATTAASLNSARARKLISTIGPATMRTIIERVWPESGVKASHANALVMRCPLPWHSDGTPSFHWDFSDGHVHCFGCKYHTSDLFRLLRDAKGMAPKEAVELLRSYAAVSVFSETATKELEAQSAHTEATRVLMGAFNRFLVRCIAPPLGDPDYSDALRRAVAPTLEWLFQVRRHLPDQVAGLPYGVMPPTDMLNKLVTELMDEDLAQRVANKQSYPDKDWREKIYERIKVILEKVDASWTYQVTFHTGYGLTEPGRIRLRRASNDKTDNLRVLPGHNENAPMGYVGLYGPSHAALTMRDGAKLRLFVVEGENDYLSIAERYREAGLSGAVFVAACGGAADLDELHAAGFDTAYVISDEPSPNFGKGEPFIRQCLKTAEHIKPYVFVGWDEIRKKHPTAKDPDDAVAAMGFRPFYDIACDPAVAKRAYASALDWSLEQIEENRLQRRISDVQALNNLAAEYGQCVKHPAVQAAFIEAAASRFGLSPGPLRNAIVQREDSAQAFRLRVTERIQSEFHPLFKVTNNRTHMMHLWHRQKRVEVIFPLHDGEAIANSIAGIHGNVYEYIKQAIGIPSFMSAGDEDGGGSLRAVEPELYYIKKLYDYLKLAAQDIIKGLPEKSDCEIYGQGQHRLPDPAREGTYAYYVVNGRTVYKGTREHADAPTVDWVELSGPADGRYLFRLEHKSWSAEITDVNDLIQGNAVTREEIKWAVGLVERAFTHWVFARQDTDPVFLARHLFVMGCPIAYDGKVIVSILGDTGSGKSTLLSVFAGGKAKRLRLLELSRSAESYSAASIYQEWNGMTLALCLDEFEDQGGNDSKSRAVAEIQTHLRNIISEQGAQVNRGSANPDEGVRKYTISTFVMFASILKARMAQDDNRRFDVDLKKCDGTEKPEVAVFETIDPVDYAKVRRILTIGLFRYAEQIRRAYDDVERELNTTRFFPYVVPSRFQDSLIPAASIMMLLGEDWRTFLRNVCERQRASGKFEAQSQDTASANIFDRLIRTPGIRLASNGRTEARFIDLLTASEEELGLLNSSGSGLYYMREAKIILISWITVQAKGGLMDKWPEYSRINHRNLKHMFDQNPHAIRNEDVERLGITKFLQQQGEIWRPYLFSAYDAKDLVIELEKHAKTTTPATSAPHGSVPAAVKEKPRDGSGNID